jgi:hypothetical protein
MDAFLSWASNNWFNLIQTVGIMGSLWMTAAAANREAKSREVENLIALKNQHDELWSRVLEKPEFERIFRRDESVAEAEPTFTESTFIGIVFVHFQTGWKLASKGAIITRSELASDMRDFFSLPLPRSVWKKTRAFRDPEFVRFVERALSGCQV